MSEGEQLLIAKLEAVAKAIEALASIDAAMKSHSDNTMSLVTILKSLVKQH
jgi:hypothetical protein